jgi:hypothetical protein
MYALWNPPVLTTSVVQLLFIQLEKITGVFEKESAIHPQIFLLRLHRMAQMQFVSDHVVRSSPYFAIKSTVLCYCLHGLGIFFNFQLQSTAARSASC